MQTLKTAAIVVLLMTVMYGAYVSMTPPEPLPADVQSMLDFNTDEPLAIDPGLPASLGELEINTPSDTPSGLPTGQAFSPQSTSIAATGAANANASGSMQEDLAISSSDLSAVSSLSQFATASSKDQTGTGNQPMAAGSPAESRTLEPSSASLDQPLAVPDATTVASTFDRPVDNSDRVPSSQYAQVSGTSDRLDPGLAPGSGSLENSALSGSNPAPNLGLANAIRTADEQYLDDKRRDALATLSIFYNTPNLSGEQRSELLSRLDPLAREVIYSQRNLLEQAHRVGQSEDLVDIAEHYDVPWQLLANINQIRDPMTILPGTELKVVRGPFRAEVSLGQQELTLFLGDLYAGRFPIGIGSDPVPKIGTYTVQDKQTSKTYYNLAGSPVPPGSPDNPYGNVWLDLGGQICIHGSPSTTQPTDKGCISLAADYADDLYGILSQGSSVTIRR